MSVLINGQEIANEVYPNQERIYRQLSNTLFD